jgi:DUF1680 family protein
MGRGAPPVVAPVLPSNGTLLPLGLDEVRVTGGAWEERQEANKRTSLRHCYDWMSRLGWVANFDRSAARMPFDHAGREFSDSEVYKLMEALAWESARSGDEWAEQAFVELSGRVRGAQWPDGYLNTYFDGPGQQPRYTDLEWGHELYCAGHLIQAAVARTRAKGHDDFLACALRLADHICDAFGNGGIERVCGHPEIEAALVELYRVTGRTRYLDQARLFVERRGRGTLGPIEFGAGYFQDDLPVREAEVLRGHAVRALYLAAGAVDFAVESEDTSLLAALKDQWANTVARRTYLTGGMGSRHDGESFGDDFELPSDRAYSETCAAVASVMFSWRLLLAEGSTRYADLIERTLYNVIAASPDEAGTSFFYVNPLKCSEPGTAPLTDAPSERAASSLRAPWFEVACCPGNVARTLASLSAYIATRSESGVQLHQYAPARIQTALPDGEAVSLTVATDYPAHGTVTITVGADASREWTLSLRIPAWARGRATLHSAGQVTRPAGAVASITRRFSAGDIVTLELPIAPRLIRPDSRIDAIRGCVAVELGPLVLCAESPDLPEDVSLDQVSVPANAEPARKGKDEVVVPILVTAQAEASEWPYGQGSNEPGHLSSMSLIPYHRWAERGPSAMRVWIPAQSQGW